MLDSVVVVYFAMHFLFRIVTSVYYDEWLKVPCFSNSNCFIMEKELDNLYSKKRMEQILRMSKIHKLSYKINIHLKDSVYNYILGYM